MTPRHRTTTAPSSGHAIAYLRVSTDEQRDSGLGLEAQGASITQAVRRHGLTLRATFTEAGLSGALAINKRPELAAALAVLKRGDVLIVAKRDRLARDVVTAALIEAAATRKGARIISAAGEGTDDDGPSGVLMRSLIDAFAQYERLVIGARTAAALRAKRARGERFSRHAPYGFRFTASTPAQLEPEPAEQTILDLMRECRAAAFSLDGTARELNRLGHRTRSGHLWRHEYIRSTLARNERPETTTQSNA